VCVLQRSTNELVVGNTGIAQGKWSWFAIQTRPLFERNAAFGLRAKDINTFLPIFLSDTNGVIGAQLVHLPLFPGYVFVRLAPTLNTRIPALRTNGVTRLVSVRCASIPTPDGEIDAIHTVPDERVPLPVSDDWSAGMHSRGQPRWFEGDS
jgi:transcription antitermination factor NusG